MISFKNSLRFLWRMMFASTLTVGLPFAIFSFLWAGGSHPLWAYLRDTALYLTLTFVYVGVAYGFCSLGLVSIFKKKPLPVFNRCAYLIAILLSLAANTLLLSELKESGNWVLFLFFAVPHVPLILYFKRVAIAHIHNKEFL